MRKGPLARGTSWVLALTLLAAAIQFWALDAQSLWYDEGFSAWISTHSIVEIIHRTANDIQPPLYYLLLHLWTGLVGSSEWTLRYFSAAMAVLTVPLLWQVGRRLFRSTTTANVVAALAAFSPLLLWYGREARMYTLVLALLLAAFLALLALFGSSTKRMPALLFVLLVTAAVYTHYYSWFVILGWALGAVVWRLQFPSPRSSARLLLAFAAPLLAYLPWIGVVATRLEEDRSYWQGTLPVRHAVELALASWMTGHSVHEVLAVPVGWLGGGLATAGLVVLGRRAFDSPRLSWSRTAGRDRMQIPLYRWLLLTLWVCLPILGLLAVSWNRPKYHPRYLIFALPPFLLLLSALVTWFWEQRWGGRILASLLAILLLGVSLFANWNVFANPAFAKADWRGVAAYLEQHREEGEPLLLVSGHAFPVLEYYYSRFKDHVHYLPPEPTLDTTQIIDLATSEELAAMLVPGRDTWLVQWQHDVVDPERVVEGVLRLAGGVVQESPTFMDVQLARWALPASGKVTNAAVPQHPLDAKFADALELLGWTEFPLPAPADEGLTLGVYWAAQRALDADYKVRYSVVDAEGFEYGALDQRPTSYQHPTFRWTAGSHHLAMPVVPLEPGTPPGEYWVNISVYQDGEEGNLDLLDAQGAPQGQVLQVGPVTVAPPTNGWLGAGPPNGVIHLNERLLDTQELLAARVALPSQLEPGQRIPLTLWWRTGGALPGATLHLGWRLGTETWEVEQQRIARSGWPGEQWRQGDLLITPTTVRVPSEIEAPGVAHLVAWLSDSSGRESEPVALASGEVVPGNRSFVPPEPAYAQEATYGDTIRLVGYDLSSTRASPASPVSVTLYWEALGEMEKSFTTFVHLLDQEGRIVPEAGQDKLPLDGTRLTDSWLPGEYVSDTFTLSLPSSLEPGTYTIEVGWYDAGDPSFPRLPASGDGADRDRVLLRTQLEQ